MNNAQLTTSLQRWLDTHGNGPRADAIRRIVRQLADPNYELSEVDRELVRNSLRDLAADAVS